MLTYFFQMMFCSAIMYGYYHFFMRNERFHHYNRFYLLSTIVLSLLLPLIKIPVTVRDDDMIYQSLHSWDNAVTVVVQKSPQFLTTSTLLLIVYSVIAVVFLLRIILSLRKIYRLKKSNPSEEINGVSFIQTSHPDTPFSFFKWLFWNRAVELNSDKGRHIFRHEMYHIEKKHSWDLVFAEIIVAFLWFNPVFFFIRREIKIIQEFLADKHATDENNIASYAETLLMQTFGTNHQQLINPFFHNQLKRRIAMLTKSKKPAYQYLRKLMVLPLVAVAIMLFSFTYNKEIKEVKRAVENKIETLDNLMMLVDAELKVTEKIKAEVKDTVPAKKVADASPKQDIPKGKYETEKKNYYFMDEVVVVSFGAPDREVIVPPRNRIDISASYPGGIAAWKNFLGRNLRGEVPTKNGAKSGIYKVNIKFIIEPDGSLSNFEPLTDEGYGMEEEAMRVLAKSEKWKPSLNDKDGETKPVRAYRVQQFVFQVLTNNVEGVKDVGIVEVKKPEPEPEIFTKVEVDAAYPGGPSFWREFLIQNLNAKIPLDHKAPPGNYTTITQFIVDKDGNISGIKPLTKLGYGMEEEAIRIIKLSGKWMPATQNGRVVRAYRKQPITFQVLEQ